MLLHLLRFFFSPALLCRSLTRLLWLIRNGIWFLNEYRQFVAYCSFHFFFRFFCALVFYSISLSLDGACHRKPFFFLSAYLLNRFGLVRPKWNLIYGMWIWNLYKSTLKAFSARIIRSINISINKLLTKLLYRWWLFQQTLNLKDIIYCTNIFFLNFRFVRKWETE